MLHPLIHHLIILGWLVADINEQEHGFQLLGCMKIILDHLSPLCLDLHIRICVTVSRQIYQIHGVIDIIEVDRLCLTRLR